MLGGLDAHREHRHDVDSELELKEFSDGIEDISAPHHRLQGGWE
jgi:hypothetical protein